MIAFTFISKRTSTACSAPALFKKWHFRYLPSLIGNKSDAGQAIFASTFFESKVPTKGIRLLIV